MDIQSAKEAVADACIFTEDQYGALSDMIDALAAPYSGEPTAVLPLSTLRWWRELVDLNPADLAPRLDAHIHRLEAEEGE